MRSQTSLDIAPTDEMRQKLVRVIEQHMQDEGVVETAVPGMSLYRRSETTACNSANYQPRLIVFVQGKKQIELGRTTYVCDENSFLLTSVDLPVLSQVVEASAEKPILGVLLRLDMPMVRETLSQQEFHFDGEPANARGMTVGRSSQTLLDACYRLVSLLDSPRDISFLNTLLQKEIIYRILCSPQGKNLQGIATLGEQSNRTAKAVEWLRENYNKPLKMQELASRARMGVSTLHHQFRLLTAMSPLQYQKQLRLHVAREKMLHGGLDAASAAFEVGYESASQFNREYKRFFGLPPVTDTRALRMAGTAVPGE